MTKFRYKFNFKLKKNAYNNVTEIQWDSKVL